MDIIEQTYKILEPSYYHNSLLPVRLDETFDARVITNDDTLPGVSEHLDANEEPTVQKTDFGKQLYVYTDIIQPVAEASDYIPLLTVVPFNATGLSEPQRSAYHKLLGQELQTI